MIINKIYRSTISKTNFMLFKNVMYERRKRYKYEKESEKRQVILVPHHLKLKKKKDKIIYNETILNQFKFLKE